MHSKTTNFLATLLAFFLSFATACSHAPGPTASEPIAGISDNTTSHPASSNATVSPAQVAGADVSPDHPQPSVLTLRAGQVLSLTAPVPRENATELRQAYYQKAFPLARKEGLFRTLALDVTSTEVGSFSPGGLVFFIWPNEASEKAFMANPEWPAIKATRPDGWEHLRIYNSKVEQDVSITFHPDKFYTAAVAWTNADNPDDYALYLRNIEHEVNGLGGRFILTMSNLRYETHTPPFATPGQITFVEWDTKDALPKLRTTEAFKQNVHLLRSGTTDFELHRVAPNKS